MCGTNVKKKNGLTCFQYCENSLNVAEDGYKILKYKHKNVLIENILVYSRVDVVG
jgi:hypothetical protein